MTGKPFPTSAARLARIYDRTVSVFGEPDDVITFDAATLPHAVNLQLIRVLVWLPDEHCDVTAFATVGMSVQRMAGADYFSELHLAFRGVLSDRQRRDMANFLANVAEYPFHWNRTVDHWHVISRPGSIPGFDGCRHLLLHPKLAEEGVDRFEDEDGIVKILYAIPITPRERHLLIDHGRNAFIDHLVDNNIDMLRDRFDPRSWYAGDEA